MQPAAHNHSPLVVAGHRDVSKVLRTPALDGLEIYLFRAIVPQKKLDIRLDKLTDVYGSPSIDDIEKCEE